MKKIIVFLAVIVFANPLFTINEYRNAVGLNSLEDSSSLMLAAKHHAKYLFINHDFSHYEKKYLKRFTGKTPSNRAVFSGYYSRYVIENISKGEENYKESVQDLFSAIYHRLAFLNFNINEIGFYKLNDIFVYDMGNIYINNACGVFNNLKSGFANLCENKNKIINKNIFYKQMIMNPKTVFWPYNHMKNTPAVFYSEIPDPLPDYEVCGYPASISFNPYYYRNKRIKLISFNLFMNGSKIKKTKIITSKNDVNHMLKKTEFVLFPLDRLKYGAHYTVKADFMINGNRQSYQWSFDVEEKRAPIINIQSRKGIYYIRPNITYLIYFKPLNRDDKLSDFRYTYKRGLRINEIGYKDANTVYLNISGTAGEKLKIKTKKRNITIIIKE